jgi:superfamily II DNA or RNA helicase
VTADDGAVGEQHLRDFQDNDKTIPTILTTSQKLSTGVDARNIRHIVLMRPIRSMIEFKQIIGRGTRTYDGKDFFTIWDFVKAHENFNDPEWDGEPLVLTEYVRAGCKTLRANYAICCSRSWRATRKEASTNFRPPASRRRSSRAMAA